MRRVALPIRGAPHPANLRENSPVARALPPKLGAAAQDGIIRVTTESGRGNVSVIQQPASDNGYTGIILISDNDGGADNYRVTAYFTPNNGGYARGNRGRGMGRDSGYGRTDDRRRDDRYDRGRGGNQAQDIASLHWSGDVDGEVQLVWRGGDVNQRLISGNVIRRASTNVSGNAMRAQNGQLTVSLREGRGRVDVVQQPSASNRYTGIIRIIDPQAGYGHYDITASIR